MLHHILLILGNHLLIQRFFERMKGKTGPRTQDPMRIQDPRRTQYPMRTQDPKDPGPYEDTQDRMGTQGPMRTRAL